MAIKTKNHFRGIFRKNLDQISTIVTFEFFICSSCATRKVSSLRFVAGSSGVGSKTGSNDAAIATPRAESFGTGPGYFAINHLRQASKSVTGEIRSSLVVVVVILPLMLCLKIII